MEPGKSIIIRNAVDNPALLRSGVSIGDVGIITEWHRNLCCGMVKLNINNRVVIMPVSDRNIL